MLSHSPGLWRKGGHWIIRDAGAAGLPVCEVWPRGVGDEKAYANENLIAAAPDLLAALKYALGFYKARGGNWSEFGEVIGGAIAKAEGKA